MNKIKKLGFLSIILVLTVSFGIGYNYVKNERTKFHKNQTVHKVFTDLAVDPEDMEAYVGLVDYIFVGRVDEYLGNFDEDSDFIPNSKYRITVLENLKGNLRTNQQIEVKKHGGYDINGDLVLFSGENIDDFLPEENKEYVFMAYGQPNGELLIAELNGNVEVSNINTYSSESESSIIQQYQEFINKEKPYNRERFKTIYEQ